MNDRDSGHFRDGRPTEHQRSGLVRSGESLSRYTMTLVTDDVGEAVCAAGGWMIDRVRAGWRIEAVIPPDCDAKPLAILGVSATHADTESDPSWFTSRPAALAVGIGVLSPANPIRTQVHALMRDPGIEITIWGDGGFTSGRNFEAVQYQLSRAAQAFKAHAMRAASLSARPVATEFLRSCTSWYPLDRGVDLDRVSPGGGSP
ncbi:hypothetical protein ACNQVK_23095 [Mycobacterium sp. 134]|uniref:hypothetical protein n=1 Tax=Mycobacterium sp. 134 TaxID=3400425 RepID=UPI003AB08334